MLSNEKMLQGFGHVRTEKEIQDDLDKAFQERMRLEQEQRERELQFRQMEEERKEQERQQRYNDNKELIEYIKTFREMPTDDYYLIIETQDGKQSFYKSHEIVIDQNYLIGVANPKYNGIYSDEPRFNILEPKDIKGIVVKEEQQEQIITIKKTTKGEW